MGVPSKNEKTDLQLKKYLKKYKSGHLTEGKENRLIGPFIFFLYHIFKHERTRKILRKIVLKIEGGDLYSVTIRKIFSKFYHRDVGFYSGAGSFCIGNFTPTPPGVTIGRYCSISYTAAGFNANHPIHLKSTHAFFYNPVLNFVEKDLLERNKLTIGNDVWLGHNSTIMPGVTSIGDGSIIGANAVVHQNVPPYGIVVGNPGRVVRYRFSKEIIEKLLKEKWWESSLEKLIPDFQYFQHPLNNAENIDQNSQ